MRAQQIVHSPTFALGVRLLCLPAWFRKSQAPFSRAVLTFQLARVGVSVDADSQTLYMHRL